MIFLPRKFPAKITVNVKRIDNKSYEITMEPTLDTLTFTTFFIGLRECTGGFTVKVTGTRVTIISEKTPDFNAIITCLSQRVPNVFIELKCSL